MTESFTEERKISYGQNIMNSFGAAALGFVLFLASFVVLWWNEGNNVAQINKANFIQKTAIEISADKIDHKNDNKLVQLSGQATTNETLSDDIITVPNTFSLDRKVEMYQWKENVKTEKKDNLGGSTTETKTYSYEKVWSATPINSASFKRPSYSNPEFRLKSEKYYAKSGKLGDFNLTEKQTRAMSAYSEYAELPENSNYKIFENKYYSGYNPENPQIGDIRISYRIIPSGTDISIIGQQKSDNTLTNMTNKGKSIYVQQSGIKNKDEMLDTVRKNNKMMTIFLRVLGWFLMFSGLQMLINPLVVIFKVVPFVEKIVGFLSKGVLMLISLILSLLTIALAWLAYRPLLSIGILLLIGGIIYAFKDKIFKKKAEEVQPEQIAEQNSEQL